MASRNGTRRGVVVGLVAVFVLAGCTTDDPARTTSTTAEAILTTTIVEESNETVDAQAGSTTTQAAPVPTGELLVDALPVIEVLSPSESEAGDVPMFSWDTVDGTSVYDVVVLSPDAPIWAWRGTETEIWMGGLPFERPEGMGGPVLEPGSCWSVVALDAQGQMIAASAFLPASPGSSDGHACIPGQGSTYDS